MVLYAHHFHDDASTCFAQAEKLDRAEPRWPYFQGDILRPRDLAASIAKLSRAAELCAGEPDTPGLALGNALLELRRFDEAEDQFNRLLLKNPANVRALLQLGRLNYLRGNTQKGLEDLRQAALDEHTRKTAHLLMAEIYHHEGDPKAAEDQRLQAAVLPSDVPWPATFDEEITSLKTGEQARLARTNELMAQKRHQEAIAILEQTVRDYPNSAWSWGMLGDALAMAGDLPRAEQALQWATQIGADSSDVPLNLGLVSLARGNRLAALGHFRQAIKRKPDLTQGHFFIGYCLLQEGNRVGASEAFQAALRCKPDFVPAHRSQAELLITDGKIAQALQHLGYALAFAPGDEKTKQLIRRALLRIEVPVGW
jgi:tetratricopeptide (TPR) repeat protein